MTVDAASEFDQVQGTFDEEANPILDFLKGVADSAGDRITTAPAMDFLTAAEIAGERGSSLLNNVHAPVEPSASDIPAITWMNEFLQWLSGQQLQAATFPTYAELFPDEPPTAPATDLSNPTTFTIQAVSRPAYSVPVWDDASAWSGGSITDEIGPLTAPFEWTGTTYTSQLMRGSVNVLYDLVKRDIEDPTHGIDELDEGRLWDRARERENRLAAQARGNATRLFAAGGFTQPTGAAQAAIAKILSESQDKISSINREIMAKKADLYLEAKKVAIANGLEVEKTTMNFYHAEMDRLLKRLTQEITSTVEVATFNLKRIELLVEKYKAYAQAFAAQVEGTTGIVKMYATEVEAEKAKADANRAIWEAFIAKNKNVIDTFVAQLQGFQTVMDARVKYHGVLADVFKSITTASGQAVEMADKQQKNIVDFRLGKYNGQVAAMKQRVDEILGFLNVKIEQLKTQAQATTAVAVGAMSALNVNLGLSLSASTSIGGSESYSHDETKGRASGPTYNYSYQYDKTKSVTPGEQRSYQEIHDHKYTEVG